MAPIQKQLRDVERSIKKWGSSPLLERRKEDLLKQKDESSLRQKEKRYAIKYHMVKFMERKKLVRKLKKLSKESTMSESDLEGKREQLLDDLTYVLYYPKHMKYLSLFGNDSTQATSSSTNTDQEINRRNKARKLARANRQQDVANGGDDKVQHAIDVESQSSSSSSHKRKLSDKAGMEREAYELVGDDDIGEDSDEPEPVRPKPQKKKRESSPSDAPIAAASKLPKVSTPVSKTSHTDPAPSDNDEEVDDAAEEAYREETDPFFLNAADESADLASSKRPPQIKVNVGDLRRLRGTYDRTQRVDNNDGSLSKQELRLLNWQLKVRGKKNRM